MCSSVLRTNHHIKSRLKLQTRSEKRMKLFKSRKALSTVVTTLIILVVSVLLAGVVTLYAINVTTTRVQEEALFLTKPHLWVKNSSYYLGAILIINTGGRDVVIDKVTVRGQTVDWSNIFYVIFKGGISEDLIFIDNVGASANTTLKNPSGGWLTLQAVSGNEDLTLKSGYSMILYMKNPDSLSLNDIGLTIGITVFTSNAQYYKETNVEAVA